MDFPPRSFHTKRGNIGRGRAAIDADIEELNALAGERRDDSAGVSGNIGHLGPGGGAAKAVVQRFRQRDTGRDHGGIDHLGLPTEGKRVPGNVAVRDSVFHALAVGGGCLFQVLVDQPRASRPDVSIRTRLPGLLCQFNGMGKIFIEIAMHNCSLGVDETRVEVALEHGQYLLDRSCRRVLFKCHCGKGFSENGATQGQSRSAEQVATLHNRGPHFECCKMTSFESVLMIASGGLWQR